jgi:hypothetical protein
MATNPNESIDLFKKQLEQTRPEREKKEADLLMEMSGTPKEPKADLPITGLSPKLENILTQAGKTKTLKQLTPLKAGATEELLKAQQAESAAAQEKVMGQAQAKGQYGIQVAERYKQVDDEFKRKMAQLQIPEFQPTQDNLLTLGTMASLIGVVGAVVGSQGGLSGIGAVQAMTGMMKGYQAGRKDVFEREKTKFQNDLQTLKSKQEALMKEFEAAYKRIPHDMAEARAGMETTLAKYDAKFLKATYDKQGPEMVIKRLDEIGKDLLNIDKMAAKTGIGSGAKGGATKEQFENITSADVANSYFRINEWLNSAKDPNKIPTGSKFLRDKGTQSGIIEAYKNYAIGRSLPSDLRANDSALLGIAFDIVAARSFGRSQGVTDSKIAQVVRQLPIEGDDENTKQYKLRILFNQLQEINKLLPESKRVAGENYMLSNKSRNFYKKYSTGVSDVPNFISEQDARNAGYKDGDTVRINGVQGVLEK